VRLGEALLERSYLEGSLERLQSRLARDYTEGRPTAHTCAEIDRTAKLLRDLNIAISWTEQQVSLSGLPLGAYRIKSQTALFLANSLESSQTEKADHYWELSHKDRRVLEAAVWLVDLQVPGQEVPDPTTAKEVEDP